MKNILIGVVVLLVIVVLGLFFGRNILARAIVVKGIQQAAGLKVDVGSVSIDLPQVSVKNITIYNPAGFTDKVMAVIPEIALDMDLGLVMKNKIYFKFLKVDVSQVNLNMNEQNKVNLNSLALLIPKGSGPAPDVKINELMIKVDKVSYKAFVPMMGVQAKEYDLRINETFRDVTDPTKVAGQIVQKIVAKVGVSSLINKVGGKNADVINSAVEGIKGLFGSPAAK